MLLGCCHCEDIPSSTPSSSVPSSSTPSSDNTISTNSLCNNCKDNVTPVHLRMTINYTGSGGVCCSAYTVGVYDVYAATSVSGGCIWKSTELPKRVSGASCVDVSPANPDFRALAGVYLNYPTLTYQLEACLNFQHITYGSVLLWYNNGVARNALPKVDCLSTLVLNEKHVPNFWERSNSGAGKPCSTESIPTTLTLVAV